MPNLEYLDLKLVYDAQADGWNADAFHRGGKGNPLKKYNLEYQADKGTAGGPLDGPTWTKNSQFQLSLFGDTRVFVFLECTLMPGSFLMILIGKAVGQPVYNLLGGLRQPDIPLEWSVSMQETREEMVDEATRAVEEKKTPSKATRGSVERGRTGASRRCSPRRCRC